jgi:hypothetical protein
MNIMARVAFILLCHKDPDAILDQVARLTAAGDYVAIHFDASAAAADYRKITGALADHPNVTFVTRRVRCGWGEWSLVEATLRGLQAALAAFAQATHFYMLSGDCMPIKSADYAHRFLDMHDKDFIESFDFFDTDWIKTGFREERLIYRHYFNERSQKRRFYAAFALQKRFNITRALPSGINVMIGSQWWCLRRRSVEAVLAFTRQRPDVIRFFRTTWIPDETFFQTLVRHLVPGREIESRTLTFLMFSDYGMPVSFYNDHADFLLGQDALFARKISAEAHGLKKRLGALYASGQADFTISNEGRTLFSFLTARGRSGRRFAPRFWEAEMAIGVGRSLLIILCKKWHVAKRLTAAIRQNTDIAAFDYLFNEAQTPLPDMGGIERSLAKRGRNHGAFMRMLYDHAGTDRVVICLDTSSLDLITAFQADRADVRMLEIECSLCDDYLIGHAIRVGLAGPQSSPATFARLLPTIRRDMIHEGDAIRDAGFKQTSRLRETATEAENAAAIAAFLGVEEAVALELARTPHLFVD